MSKNNNKLPGINILARYALGEKEMMKYWSKFIENDADSLEKVEILKKLWRLLEARERSRFSPGSQMLAAEIFNRFQVDRKRRGKNIAHLYFDSHEIPVREGFRPSLVSERRLKYAGRTGTIELSVVPVFPGRFEVTGRLEEDGSGRDVEVSLKGRRSHQVRSDEFGFFSFGAVDPGTYMLLIREREREVVVHDLILR